MGRLVTATLVACVLALAACGGDDDDEGDGAATSAESETAGDASATAPEPTGPDGGSEDGDDDGDEDGDEDGATESQPATRAQYIRQADEICQSTRPDLARLADEFQKLLKQRAGGKISDRQYNRRGAALTSESATIAAEAVAALEALPRPRSRREALERYLAGTAAQARLLEEQAGLLREGKDLRVGKLNARSIRVANRTRAAARRFGFQVCGGA